MKLQPFIGAKKTLVISTEEVEQLNTLDSRIFIHVVNWRRLLQYDREQQEVLKYYIEQKVCSQVIVVGTKDPELISAMQQNESVYSLASPLNFNLTALLREKHDQILSAEARSQMLKEFLVIRQCKVLMDYFFIKEIVLQNKLNIQGLVPLPGNDQVKSIYYNGIVYNDLLTLN